MDERLLELYGIKYDSLEGRPNMAAFLRPEINYWLNAEKADRFHEGVVLDLFAKEADKFGRPELLDSNDKSKQNFCFAVIDDIIESGRKASIFSLLDDVKEDAITRVLEDNNERIELEMNNYSPEALDEAVIGRLIKFYYEFVDNRSRQIAEEKGGIKLKLNKFYRN